MKQRFNDREVGDIFRKASVDSHKSDAAAAEQKRLARAQSGGLSLSELKLIATEVGIDPYRIEVAAQSLVTPPERTALGIFIGSPERLRIHSEVESVVDDDQLRRVLEEIRATMGVAGESRTPLGGLEWASEDNLGRRDVVISSTSGGTRIEVSADFEDAARSAAEMGAAVGISGLVGMTAAVAAIGPVGWALAPVVAAGAVIVPRLTKGHRVSRESKKLSELAARLYGVLTK